MSEQKQEWEVTDVGGVHELRVVLKPGVNLLVGPNGGGKTSAFNALTRGSGGDVSLERRDGVKSGRVLGPGVELRVGKVTKQSGEAEMKLLTASHASTLIDPGLKGEEASRKAMLRALAGILEIPGDDEALEVLCGGDAEIALQIAEVREPDGDVIALAEAVRLEAQRQARGFEKQADEAEGQVKVALLRLEESGMLPEEAERLPTVEEARAKIAETHEVWTRGKDRCDAREELEETQKRVRATMEPTRPDLEGALKELQGLNDAVIDLEKRLSAMIEKRDAAAAVVLRKEQEVERWDRQQEILSEPVQGPTREEVAGLERAYQQALKLGQSVMNAEELRKAIAARDRAVAQRDSLQKSAEHYREISAGVNDALGKILSQSDTAGFTVRDGEVYAKNSKGEVVSFRERMSPGERIAAVLDLVMSRPGYADGRILPLQDVLWLRLQPKNRKLLAKRALERGLYVLTEEPTDGELAVTHLPEEK